jgi:WD40 repeat protein
VTETLAPSHATERRLAGTPFVGLVPYGEGDAAFFFGRDAEKEIVAGNLRAARLTILYGASGVGKSSLLHAGVVHDLHEQVRSNAAARAARMPFAICAFSTWREDPLPALAEAMQVACVEALGGEELPSWRPGEPLVEAVRTWTERVRPLLVVLDQFEDYFLYHAGEDGEGTFAVEFPRLVNEPNLHVNFVVSLREDAWAKLDRFEGRIPALFANYLRVEHLRREAARDAIEGPVEEWNRRLPSGETPYAVEPALVETVIEAAAAGSLGLAESGNGATLQAASGDAVEAPFLQLVLDRLWRATVETGAHTLDLARLEALGGAQQIVQNHLLEALGKLTPTEQPVAADLFRFLVTRSKTKIAHPAADLAEWTGRPEPEVTAVLEKLCRGESGRILRSVSPPAGETTVSYELFHDVLAEPILEWRKEYEQQLERTAEAQRQRAVRRRLFRLAALLVLISLAFAAFAGWALYERRQAAKQADVARSQALAAQATQALSSKPATALALGVKALETSRTPEAEVALRRAILANPVEYVIPATRKLSTASAEDATYALAFSSDGKRVRGITPDGVIHSWRSADGNPLTPPTPSTKRTLLAPGGGVLAADGGAVRLVGPGGSPSSVRRLRVGEHVLGLGFAGNTPLALVASPRSARVLNVATGSSVPLRARVSTTDAVFSGDGSRVVTLAGESRTRVWDARNGRPLATLPATSAYAISPDGRFVATIGDRQFQEHSELWSVDGRKRVADLGPVVRVVFSPHGRLLMAVGVNGEADIWKTSAGQKLASLPGFGSLLPATGGSSRYWTLVLPGAAFSPDGRLVAVADGDGIVRVWELATRKQVAAVAAGWASALAFAPRGGLLAAMTWEGDVIVARAPASLPLRTGFGNGCAYGFDPVVSQDGRQVVAPAAGGTAGVWNRDGKLERVLKPPARPAGSGSVIAAAFSGDGTTTAAAGESGNGACGVRVRGPRYGTVVSQTGERVRLRRIWETSFNLELDPHGSLVVIGRKAWRTETGARMPTLNGILGLSRNGRLALVRRGPTSSIVQVPSGRPVTELRSVGPDRNQAAAAVFSPDGSRLVTESSDEASGYRILRLWDTSSGEPVARLGRTAGRFFFADGGGQILVAFDDHVATFSAANGARVSSVKGSFDAISSDGTIAATARKDGSVEVVDLMTGVRVGVQTDTAEPLTSVAFGPNAGLLVARDEQNDVHVLRCAICATDDELLAHAHATLAVLSRFKPKTAPLLGVA